jgi:hypothetical protein
MQFQNMLGGVASGSTVRVETLDATQTGNVGIGGSELTTINAPAGWIYRVRALFLSVVAPGATSGRHEFAVLAETAGSRFYVIRGVSNFAHPVIFGDNQWTNASLITSPLLGAQQAALASMVADDTTALMVQYINSTDAVQVNDREIGFVFERVAI